jgi:5-methylcytosine-specific restriction endonuclease McrA
MNTKHAPTLPSLRYRPIYGGPFGRSGKYVMATMACTERGLHAVRYMVVEPATGGVLSTASDKQEALASARRLLRAAEALSKVHAANDEQMTQEPLWPEEATDGMLVLAGAKPKSVSRRRRDIFDKCRGRCHYCQVALDLDGKWHIEHMQARALGGFNTIGNLVASCVPCNLEKADRTALEFITQSKTKTIPSKN